MNKADIYLQTNLLNITDNGNLDENPRPKYKDGTPAHSKFITQVFETYNIGNGEFPISVVKQTPFKMAIKEVLWIYQDQDSSLVSAHNRGITWWDEWNIGDDTIGLRYGATIKKYDLFNKLLFNLKTDPFSRRHIINMYQENDLNETKGLNPCAYETLWSVRKINNEFILDLTLIQRSNDYLMAGLINKIQYVALMMMVAGHLKYKVGVFCHLVQNLHVYDRHMDFAHELINKLNVINNVRPSLILDENKNFYDYTINDFEITGLENISYVKPYLEIAI